MRRSASAPSSVTSASSSPPFAPLRAPFAPRRAPALLAASALVWLVASAFAACGGTSDVPSAPGGGDAGATPDAFVSDASGDVAVLELDAGGIDAAPGDGATAYPAFIPDVPTITNHDGSVLSSAKIVTIVWTADPNYKTYESFSDAIGTSDFWKAATSEYGAGPARSGGHVEIATTPPASFDTSTANDEIDAFIVKGVKGAPANGWPVPDDQTLYVLYIPEATAILDQGVDACAQNVGYHTETQGVAAHPHVVYGVVAEKCHDAMTTVVDNATETAAHEIVEAATDPHTDTDLAWTGFDVDHYVWELFQERQDENADACEFFPDSYYKDAQLGASMQRIWSNQSALAGKNPCVPEDRATPYFNVTPLAQEFITTTGTTGKLRRSKGFQVPVGSTKTIDVGFFSDAPTDAWTLTAKEGDGFTAPVAPHLTLAVDKGTGNNGDVAHVAVTVTSTPTKGNQIIFTLLSTQGTVRHMMPILVGAYP